MVSFQDFSDPSIVRKLIVDIQRIATKKWRLMEVCGGQTHSIIRHGIDQLLSNQIEMIHGPGCPVCVTPRKMIDKAIALASDPQVILCTFGDMLRVPGSNCDLRLAKSRGNDIRILYSPLDSLNISKQNPNRQIVFLAIGFETTAPAHAMTLHLAAKENILNFSMLSSLVRVPPALRALLIEPGHEIDAILAAGHVCSVMGLNEYPDIVNEFKIPIVVTGFEPIDLLSGIRSAVTQLETGVYHLKNSYYRVVQNNGNNLAQAMIDEIFEPSDCEWRGMGIIPRSGLKIRDRFRDYNAEHRFDLSQIASKSDSICRSGEVLRGRLKPNQCEAYGIQCNPENPLGPTMVSNEGACAAYYLANKLLPIMPRYR